MSSHVLFDEFQLRFHAPKDLDDAVCDAIGRILENRPFRSALCRAVRQVVRPYLDLDSIRVRISS